MVVLVATVAVPSAAASASADELIKEGVALRRQGNDLGALQRFEQAFQIESSPRALAQIGLAEQALGRWVAAHEHLTQALDSKADAWIVKNRRAITDALAVVGEHVGRLEILGASPDAEVRVDGIARGKLPLPAPVTVATGTVTVDLSAPGFLPVQRNAVIRPGQTTRETFNPLIAVPRQAAPTPALGVAAPPPPAQADGVADQRAADASTAAPATLVKDAASGPSALRSGAKWVAWGLGAAALGVGAFGYVQQTNAADEFDRDCELGADGQVQVQVGHTTTPRTECVSRKDRVDSGFRVEVIGLVSAGALVATGLLLWLSEPPATRRDTAAWGCAPAMTQGAGWWVGCRLRF
jgi:hypothetical protein